MKLFISDEAKLERLRLQMNQDEAERKILKERVGEINKVLTSGEIISF